ncbi:MAG: RNA degradosome polyphosphate kinase [Clostridium sp.]|nr:RNA degradosome polyphosphate kinase [Clostridium sp.]
MTQNERFTNRELSWLAFNKRVLSEAKDNHLPLMERLKFLSITASNLDEFFMVRVASLKDQVNAGYTKKDIAGMTSKEQIDAILKETHKFTTAQYNTYNRSFLPSLKKNGLKIVTEFEKLTEEQADYVDNYFQKEVFPVLTPMAVDSSRPFPLIRNRSLNIGALLMDKKKKGTIDFATVQVPSVLPRVVTIPTDGDNCTTVILLEQIIEKNIQKLFLNYRVLCQAPFRVMRNADLSIDEDEAADLLIEIEKQLKKRQWGEAIRLEVEDNIDKRLLKTLRKEFNLSEDAIFKINGPLDLTFLMKVYDIEGFDHLKEPKYIPQQPKMLDASRDLFEQIREHDILLHHPYETFDPVVNFVKKAASDPNVLAIKQTLYRVSSHSPIIASLAQAAENGKQVSVLVELKARFDEENNIVWAKKLEKAGCHVIYGLVGLKTHSKITLVVRKEEDEIRRYVHLGTGNYNDSTAKLYTDMGMFTSKTRYGEDATAVFNMLSGYSEPLVWNKLSLAPLWLRSKFLSLIEREKEHAKNGRPARIIAKMNSLCDPGIIEALYDASEAGVEIDLIVRGICCLRAGIKGLSEHIRVCSIVGTFLEHSRIFYFENNGNAEYYMGSADWMPRNLDKRVEILFPVEDPILQEEIYHILHIQLSDTKKAHLLMPDGHYVKVDQRGKTPLNSQLYFCEEAMANAKK